MPQVSDELKDMLNQAIARELQVSIQYMWQHVLWRGVKGFAVKGELRSISIAEMKHAEAIAERLFYLGATPTTKPEPIIARRRAAGAAAARPGRRGGRLELYRRIVLKARDEGDIVTEELFRASSPTRRTTTTPSRACSRSSDSRGGRPAPAPPAVYITILLSGYSTMPCAPASLRRGMISRTTRLVEDGVDGEPAFVAQVRDRGLAQRRQDGEDGVEVGRPAR